MPNSKKSITRPGVKAAKLHWSNRKVSIDFKVIFENLTKGFIMLKAGKPWDTLKEAVSIIKAFSLKDTPGDLAYEWLLTALVNAAHTLIDENRIRLRSELQDEEKLYDYPEYEEFLDGITAVLEEREIIIDNEALKHPRSMSIVQDFQQYLRQWLILFKMEEQDADMVVNRFPTYFTYALYKAWQDKSSAYQKIKEQLDNPLGEATNREFVWQAYYTYLDREIEQPLFGEPFGLKDVFVALRCFKDNKRLYKDIAIRDNSDSEQEGNKRKVEWLEKTMNAWLNDNNANAIQVLSGGPGSGKSSFAKWWAVQVAQREGHYRRVLFIPLHLLSLESSVSAAVKGFLESNPDIPINFDPLQIEDSERLLVIFDGLDELAMQGKSSQETAYAFVEELRMLCTQKNQSKCRLKILLCGRPISVQNAEIKFRDDAEVIQTLPYFISKNQQNSFEENKVLVPLDQRVEWWVKYFQLKGIHKEGLPKEISQTRFDEITAEPLLNYLVALAWQEDPTFFSLNTNINGVYETLIRRVYKREYQQTHKAAQDITEDRFFQILEEIAICAWQGGDVRVTTVRKIEEHLREKNLDSLLEEYKKANKEGVSRLLTAFYFKKHGKEEETGDETFEFTHKSFGEYLTARAIVELMVLVHNLRKKNRENNNPREPNGWSIERALNQWLYETGEAKLDRTLYQFIVDEIHWRVEKGSFHIDECQFTIAELLRDTIENGMPFSQHQRKSHKEERRMAINAETMLLAVHSACGTVGQKVSDLQSGLSQDAIMKWIVRLQESYGGFGIAKIFFNHISVKPLYGTGSYRHSDIGISSLSGTNFSLFNFSNSILNKSGFFASQMHETNFESATLINTSFQGAAFSDTNFFKANLQDADFKHAFISYANFSGANLKNVSFMFTKFENAEGLTFKALSTVKTLYGCSGLGARLEKRLRIERPHLFVDPGEDE